MPANRASLQGAHFFSHSFPSSWNSEDNRIFTSSCRCLIDLETKLIVLLPKDLLSVLEIDDKTLIPDTSEVWSRETCVNKLKEILSKYSEADISKIRFPFFDKIGQSKNRPSITLYSPDEQHMLFIALYCLPPTQNNLPKHIIQLNRSIITPKNSNSRSENALIDCSKLCSVPFTNDDDELTYQDCLIDRHPIKLYDPEFIRKEIIRVLLTLAWENPITHYQDITRKIDIGCWVERIVERDDGELCTDVVMFE